MNPDKKNFTPASERLFTGEFLALNGIAFLAFCNMAVFFQFYLYLRTLPIAPEWNGFLIALFSISGLILRPFVSPFLNPGNARKWMLASVVAVVVSLFGYSFAMDFWSMFLIRFLHGIAYMVLGAALNARLVALIPPAKSGQAFGLITVITLLPFALIPPILDAATENLGGFVCVLNLAAVLMILIFPVSLAVKTDTEETSAGGRQNPGMVEIIANLKDKKVFALLLLMLLLYSSYTPVFFFLEGYAKSEGILNPGLFLTLSTFSEIGIRLAAGSLFDRISKVYLVAGSLIVIAFGYWALAFFSGTIMFYSLGVFLGLGWGVAMPVLNAMMFDVSPVRLRGFNTNLGVQMFQGGFFVGPLAGGLILAHFDYRSVYLFSALLAMGAVALTPLLIPSKKTKN